MACLVPDAREGMGTLEGELGAMGCGVFRVSGAVPGWTGGCGWRVGEREEGGQRDGMG